MTTMQPATVNKEARRARALSFSIIVLLNSVAIPFLVADITVDKKQFALPSTCMINVARQRLHWVESAHK